MPALAICLEIVKNKYFFWKIPEPDPFSDEIVHKLNIQVEWCKTYLAILEPHSIGVEYILQNE